MHPSIQPLKSRVRLSAAVLQSELVTHLRSAQMSFLLEQDRYALCIPGHLPIPWPSGACGATGAPAFYEETTTLVLNYLLERFRPSVLFDVGAAAGYFARVAASYKRHETKAHAFEMRPDKISEMRGIVSSDIFGDRVSIHHAAVSDVQRSPAPIWFARSLVFENQPAGAEYREAWWRQLKFLMRGDRTRGLSGAVMPLTSIDSFAGRENVRPDVVKIDVEGYEGRVLKGGENTFGRHRPFVLLELHKDKMLRFGATRPEVARIMFDLGYEALFFTDHQNKVSCDVVPVRPGSSLLARQETDLILFAHPDYLSSRYADALQE
jgi:FkbM family methyltransferase